MITSNLELLQASVSLVLVLLKALWINKNVVKTESRATSLSTELKISSWPFYAPQKIKYKALKFHTK